MAVNKERRIKLTEFLTPEKFAKRFPDESSCFSHLFKIKYPDGFQCKHCHNQKFHQLKARPRVLQCTNCRHQTSLTSGTIFERTRTPLLKWYWAFYYISQHKKGISSVQLGKNIGVSDMTAWLILMKIRRSMQENATKYQIGGSNSVVQADESDIGGKGKQNKKQKVLFLLEKDEKGKRRRLRYAPIPDKSRRSLELNLIPQVLKKTKVQTDGNPAYHFIRLYDFDLDQVSHRQENFEHSHLKDLNMIIGNFKNWIRGIHSHIDRKNTAYYLNEFAYRFNRRRTESNIFDRLLKRSVNRHIPITYKKIVNDEQYLPMAA